MAATSTYKTYLMHYTSGTTPAWEKLVDITEFPNLGGDPELLDCTTLSDKMRVYIMGIENTEGLSFGANYDKTTYNTLSGMSGNKKYAVWFGGTLSGTTMVPDGSEGKFSLEGELSVYVNGAGVNAVRTMTITIAPSTEISFAAS